MRDSQMKQFPSRDLDHWHAFNIYSKKMCWEWMERGHKLDWSWRKLGTLHRLPWTRTHFWTTTAPGEQVSWTGREQPALPIGFRILAGRDPSTTWRAVLPIRQTWSNLSTPWSDGLSQGPSLAMPASRADLGALWIHFMASVLEDHAWLVENSCKAAPMVIHQLIHSLPILQLLPGPRQLPTLLCWHLSAWADFAFLAPPVCGSVVCPPSFHQPPLQMELWQALS